MHSQVSLRRGGATFIASEMQGVVGGKSKRAVYNWADPKEKGRFRWIAKDQLYVDHAYQRDDVSSERVNTIARDFSWAAFGVLLVVRRDDETHWVYDGQHRLGAAHQRDDITELPCMVFGVRDTSEEAASFVKANTARGPVKAVDAFKAAIVAGDADCVGLKAALEELDYQVSKQAGVGRLKCVASLLSQFRRDERCFRRALLVCYGMFDGGSFDGRVFAGFCAADRHIAGTTGENLGTPRIADKLQQLTSEEVEKEQKRFAITTGCSGIEAYKHAIIGLLNKGWRNRIPVSVD